jgi:hypothetical protein
MNEHLHAKERAEEAATEGLRLVRAGKLEEARNAERRATIWHDRMKALEAKMQAGRIPAPPSKLVAWATGGMPTLLSLQSGAIVQAGHGDIAAVFSRFRLGISIGDTEPTKWLLEVK